MRPAGVHIFHPCIVEEPHLHIRPSASKGLSRRPRSGWSPLMAPTVHVGHCAMRDPSPHACGAVASSSLSDDNSKQNAGTPDQWRKDTSAPFGDQKLTTPQSGPCVADARPSRRYEVTRIQLEPPLASLRAFGNEVASSTWDSCCPTTPPALGLVGGANCLTPTAGSAAPVPTHPATRERRALEEWLVQQGLEPSATLRELDRIGIEVLNDLCFLRPEDIESLRLTLLAKHRLASAISTSLDLASFLDSWGL
eukprot:COSAG06_NODE_10012_length_1769_cov_1.273653_2_plen_251_part_01